MGSTSWIRDYVANGGFNEARSGQSEKQQAKEFLETIVLSSGEPTALSVIRELIRFNPIDRVTVRFATVHLSAAIPCIVVLDHKYQQEMGTRRPLGQVQLLQRCGARSQPAYSSTRA
jgi:hypothetical protein